jgi:serine/threonine-protein kinase HipA
MKFKNTPLVHVFYGSEKLSVGRLAIKNRRIFFEYDPAFLRTNLQISPFKLPLKAGLMGGEETIFEGLFGVFNDSLPDGWGRLLLDRKLLTLGVSPNMLSPLDRLCYAGKSLGAFSYEL